MGWPTRGSEARGTARGRASRPRGAGGLIFSGMLLALFAACGTTARDPGSGGAHFLMECQGPCPDGLSCLCRVCTKSCDAASDCGSFPGAECMTTGCGIAICALPCAKRSDCADLGPAASCEFGRCKKPVPPPADFAACEYPPPSRCTRAETCPELDCGGLEFDASGCGRTPCSFDADCEDGARCTAITCANTSSCDYVGAVCECGGELPCIRGHRCNPVEVVGPAGDWTSITVEHGPGFCSPPSSCTETWTIAADGAVTGTKAGEPFTVALTPFDLDQLRTLIDGPDLRLALRDGLKACNGVMVSDARVFMHLDLSTGPLERDVTNCVLGLPALTNVFQLVDEIVMRY